MNKLEIETNIDPKISGSSGKNILEIEDSREAKVSGEHTSLTLQKRADSKITLYMTEPQTIIIQKNNDRTETVYV